MIKFTVKLAITGTNLLLDNRALQDLKDELSSRPNLGRTLAVIDNSGKKVLVQVESIGSDPKMAADIAAEELFEIAGAVIQQFKTLRIEIVDIEVASNDNPE
jgi:hypothetical protein